MSVNIQVKKWGLAMGTVIQLRVEHNVGLCWMNPDYQLRVDGSLLQYRWSPHDKFSDISGKFTIMPIGRNQMYYVITYIHDIRQLLSASAHNVGSLVLSPFIARGKRVW